jgi:hypothetical protein
MSICNPIKRVSIGQMKTPTSNAGKHMSLGCLDSHEISKKAIFVFGVIICCNEMLHMRSSRVFISPACQCQTRNSPGFNPSILATQLNLMAADEAVLNKLLKKKLNKISPFNVVISHYFSPWLSWDLYILYTGKQRQTRQTERWTGKRADRQTCRQANVQTGKRADRQTGGLHSPGQF